jgi:hypothetical protein
VNSNNQNPIIQILINGFFIYVAGLIGIFLFTKNYTIDHGRQIAISILISAAVQATYRENNQTSNKLNSKQQTPKVSYQAKYRKLLSMVGGNKATCDRLIARYGIDKAIFDLERDRDIR